MIKINELTKIYYNEKKQPVKALDNINLCLLITTSKLNKKDIITMLKDL
ncbi:hypothetical protein BN85401550 [Alteracholeplasma palmae J233]|uniref:Uncharacterized protein n=1 Tax=Alteracholeplasma palmae (strain ATCC 49389 / J233) TaxID=1318466 RepID=U4KJU8_ALTPJ|nr:hypothetical protein [Alteracholeplasma palmae]CCV63732.1 hypothetical protein BN85401550 [Alteracholeplasma palmae J233]